MINDECYLNYVRHVNKKKTVLMADSEKKLQDHIHRVVEKSETKGLIVKGKKTEGMVFRKIKKKRPRCELRTGDINIKRVQNVLIKNEKYDTEIRSTHWSSERDIRKAKEGAGKREKNSRILKACRNLLTWRLML